MSPVHPHHAQAVQITEPQARSAVTVSSALAAHPSVAITSRADTSANADTVDSADTVDTVCADPATSLAQVSWLTVLPWPDPVIDQLGVDPRSDYVERYWLPLVGPASVLLMRYLAQRFDETPDGFSLDVAHTARILGLGTGLGRWGPLQRTVHRCANFGFARRWGNERVLARRHLPTVTRQQLTRLPEDRQALHEQWRVELARPRVRPGPTR